MGQDVVERAKTPIFREKPETVEHRLWRLNVLSDHLKTSEYLSQTINGVRDTKRQVRKSIIETRKVLDTWDDYSDKYSRACRRLSQRVNKSLQRDEIVKLFKDNESKIHTHHRAPTKCYLAKCQTKIVVDTKRKPFSL